MKTLIKKLKQSVRKAVHVAAYFVWKKFNKYPRFMKVLYSINDRLHIVNSRDEARQLYASAGQRLSGRTALQSKPVGQFTVAAILDEFSYNSFRYECNLLPIEPTDWKHVFEREKPDLFLCESAWSGVDSRRRPWLGQVYTSENFRRENREVLLSILAYCKDYGIPTVFWNKEDPAHYGDKVHNFIATAALFDYIFTTDIDCVQRYRQDYGHKNVHCLMFATQPRLFNPIEKYDRTEDIVFAGSWYTYHEQRCREMEAIFDKILASGRNLVIYNRNHGDPDPHHIFPEKYTPFLRPSLPYAELDRAYKGSRYALNINTVTESETMFARRVFELMSSNTFVLSNYSKGVETLFGGNVLFTGGDLAFEDIDRKREENLYHVLSRHTYANRFRQILDTIGLPYAEEERGIALCYVACCEGEAQSAVDSFHRVTVAQKRCILFLSEAVPNTDVGELYSKYHSGAVEVYSEHYIRNYAALPHMDSPYFIFPDAGMQNGFPAKAALHFSYLGQDCSVHEAQGGKYRFETVDTLTNRLFCGGQFENVADALLSGRGFSLPSFGI
jgi:hypothetical protein